MLTFLFRLSIMNLLQNDKVQEYISTLAGKSPCHYIRINCQCLQENMPLNGHDENAKPYSDNMVQLEIKNLSPKNLRPALINIRNSQYFNGISMMFLVKEMLNCKTVVSVEQHYNILDKNLTMHPPCAPYMNREYEHFIITPYKYFEDFEEDMSLWDYLMQSFNKIINGNLLYGSNRVFDLAFKRCFSFCVSILLMNFELCKKNGFSPLISKLLNFNPNRKTRKCGITKMLDMLFNSGLDFQMPVINLAILVNEMMTSND